MKKLILSVVLVAMAASGCESAAPSAATSPAGSSSPVGSSVVPSPSATPASSTVSTSPSPSPSPTAAPDSIVFIEREPDRTFDQIAVLIKTYQLKLADAVNTNAFAIVEPYLAPSGKLYAEQKELVANLHSRRIEERFDSTEIYGYTTERDGYKVEVMEKVEVVYPDRGAVLQEHHWYYTVVKADGKLLISGLEEWPDYEQAMLQRSGAVKADGYYVDLLLNNFPGLLEKAVNTLDITDLKAATENDTVLERIKELIRGFRRAGSGYSFQWLPYEMKGDTLSPSVELQYQYTDLKNAKQQGTQKLNLQLEEKRSFFSGKAVIRYLEAVNKVSPSTDPLAVISKHVRRIHIGMPDYLFQVYGRSSGTKQGGSFRANKIEVYDPAKPGQPLQTLAFEETSTWDGSTLGVLFEDMNFDGYMDLLIQADMPAGPNIPYLYWLWDPGASRFIPDAGPQTITSPEFDPERKLIRSSVRGSANSYEELTYSFAGSAPVLEKRVEKVGDPDRKVWRVKIEERINGSLQVTGQYEEPLKE